MGGGVKARAREEGAADLFEVWRRSPDGLQRITLTGVFR
jgi:hypothetical protein